VCLSTNTHTHTHTNTHTHTHNNTHTLTLYTHTNTRRYGHERERPCTPVKLELRSDPPQPLFQTVYLVLLIAPLTFRGICHESGKVA
jgi:hypothetical protein